MRVVIAHVSPLLILRVLWLLKVSQLSAFSDAFVRLVAAQLIFAILRFPLVFQYAQFAPEPRDAADEPLIAGVLATLPSNRC